MDGWTVEDIVRKAEANGGIFCIDHAGESFNSALNAGRADGRIVVVDLSPEEDAESIDAQVISRTQYEARSHELRPSGIGWPDYYWISG